jgi:hypothetical protein
MSRREWLNGLSTIVFYSVFPISPAFSLCFSSGLPCVSPIIYPCVSPVVYPVFHRFLRWFICVSPVVYSAFPWCFTLCFLVIYLCRRLVGTAISFAHDPILPDLEDTAVALSGNFFSYRDIEAQVRLK